MSQLVLLAHTRAMSASARAIVAELRRLGYDVSRIAPPAGGSRAVQRRLAACRRLIVIGSRKAGVASALRGLAARAKAAGKLVVLQVDANVFRTRPGFARPAPHGRRRAPQWRRLIGGAEGLVQARPAGARTFHSTSPVVTAATGVLLGLVASAAAYLTDAVFAARVDEFARLASSQAAMFVKGLIG